MQKNKRLVVLFAVVLIVVVSIISLLLFRPCRAGFEKVIIGIPDQKDIVAPLFVAEDRGYFTKNCLDVALKEYASGVEAVQDLVVGNVDIAVPAEFVVVRNSFDNTNLRIIAALNSVEDKIWIIARNDHGISIPTDLNHKKIGVVAKSSGEYFLSNFLTFNHLDIADVELIGLKPAEMKQKLITGNVSAVVIWESVALDIETALGGTNAITWSAQGDQRYYFVLTSTEEVIRSRPRIVKPFLRSLTQAEQFIAANPVESRKIIANLSGDEAYISSVWLKNDFQISLFQDLLLLMEDEGRWALENNLTNTTAVPNYLNYIYIDALEEIKPEAVALIH